MLTVPLNIEELEVCQPLLQRAKDRVQPVLAQDEFIEIQRLYRNAHHSPDDKPSGFFGKWAYTVMLNGLADTALKDYLNNAGISVQGRTTR